MPPDVNTAGHERALLGTLQDSLAGRGTLVLTSPRRIGRYATIQLYERHAPMQYVSEQLGHTSIKITVDIYGHPRQGTNTLADRLDRRGTRNGLQLSATG